MNLVSIIIPIYNCEKYISGCINSILEQSYKNYEIILVDDGSTDSSFEICQEFSKKNSRIKVFHQENSGVSSARNLGIKKAKGFYLCFIDSDDLLHKDYLKILVNGYEKNDVELSIASYQNISDFKILKCECDNEYEVNDYNVAIARIFNDPNFFGFPWNKLYLKKYVCKLGDKPFDEDIYMCEDTLFNIKYLTLCKKVCFNLSKIYFYYCRPGSVTFVKKIDNKKVTAFKSLDRIENLLKRYSKSNMVFLYKFYLYNYYSFKLMDNDYKIDLGVDKKCLFNKLLYVIKSADVSITEKIKITFRFYFPKINSIFYDIKKKTRGEKK